MWRVAIILTLTSLVPTIALAYLDPGTGSMLLQVLLGGLAAVGVAFKLYWHRIKSALGVSRKPESEDQAS